jgi:predicted  nucleic acid-binding Zn-ribbon protein
MPIHEQLHSFYLLDQQLRGLRGRLDAATRMHTVQKARLDQFATQHNEINDQLHKAQVAANAHEGQSRDSDTRIAKLREQMNAVRSNKEYQALLVEVNTAKLEKSKLEDQALEQLAKVDELKARLTEIQGKIDEQQKLVAVAQSQVDTARAEVGQQVDELTGQRQAAAGQLPPDVLATYERVARENEGEAMASVIEEDRRRMEYTCGGCYMGVPRECINALLKGRDTVVTCTNCGRILYLDEAFKTSMTAK